LATPISRPGPVTPGLILLPPVAALGIACGVTVLLITVFNYLAVPISRDLGTTPTAAAGAISLHLAMLIVSLPAAGFLADRFGSRPVVIGSALLFGTALYGASLAQTGGQLRLALVLAGIVGAGASPISYARTIVRRFDARRGLALGVALTGTGLGGILLPMLVQPVVVEQGWRAAFVLLAALAGGIGCLAGLLVGTDRGTASSAAGAAATGYSLAEAARTPAFRTMVAAFALLGVALSGVTAHLSEIFTAQNLDAAAVPRFQAVAGIATIIGRLAGGALMDVMPARFVGGGAALVGAAGIALLALAPPAAALVVVAAAMGLCTGTESDVVSYLSSRFFGLKAFARIYAVQGSFFMIGFAAGPILAAAAFGAVGTAASLYAAAAILTLSGLLLLSVRAPADGR
jgi:MFS family permease